MKTKDKTDSLPDKIAKHLKEHGSKGGGSGLFDLPKDERCKDHEHDPPGYMVIPQGKGYRHVCPSCGHVTTVIPTQISLNTKKKGFDEIMKTIEPYLPKESIICNPKYVWESGKTKGIPFPAKK